MKLLNIRVWCSSCNLSYVQFLIEFAIINTRSITQIQCFTVHTSNSSVIFISNISGHHRFTGIRPKDPRGYDEGKISMTHKYLKNTKCIILKYRKISTFPWSKLVYLVFLFIIRDNMINWYWIMWSALRK